MYYIFFGKLHILFRKICKNYSCVNVIMDIMKKKGPVVLITGGAGLVGNGIKHLSSKYGHYHFVFTNSREFNLCNIEQTVKLFEKYRPTYVIHLAANVGGLYKNMNHKVDMLEKNLLINYNVIHTAHQFQVKKLIACLSTCIFPDKVEYPICEDDLHNGPPHDSNDAYAYAKRMLEIHCKAYRESPSKDNFVCIVPTNIYGPHDNFHLEDAHVLPALIHKCFLAKQENKDFIVRGSGTPLRQFIYSHDLGELIMQVLEKYDGDKIILSPPESHEVSIGDVARFVAREFDYEDKIKFDSNYSDGQYKKTVSNTRLEEFLDAGTTPFTWTSIETGIKQTVKWFLEEKTNIKC